MNKSTRSKPAFWDKSLNAQVGITWERHNEIMEIILPIVRKHLDRPDFFKELANLEEMTTLEKLVVIDVLASFMRNFEKYDNKAKEEKFWGDVGYT